MFIKFKNELNITKYQRVKYFASLFFSEHIIEQGDVNLDQKIQFDQDIIKKNISDLQNETKYLESATNLVEMLFRNPEQVKTFIKKEHFMFIFNGLMNPQSTYVSLIILIYIIRSDHILDFFPFIKKNEFLFFKVINDILDSADESLQIITIMFLHILSSITTLNDNFPILLIKYHVLLHVNELISKNNNVDYIISRFYALLSDCSFGNEAQTFLEEIFPILKTFCQHQDPEIISKSIDSLRLLAQHIPLAYKNIISESMIDIFIEYLHYPDFPEIPIKSLDLLNSCIQYQDFPFELIFRLNLIESVFDALQYNDELANSIISLFNSILQIPEQDAIQEAVSRCSNYNFLRYFSSQPLKIKIEAVDVFDSIIKKLTPERVSSICTEDSITFILDLIASSDDQFLITQKIICILGDLISLYRNDPSFIECFLENANELGSIDCLIQFLDDPEITPDCNNMILAFLDNIEMLKNELEL